MDKSKNGSKKEIIKYHTELLNIINKFKNPKRGKLISKAAAFNGLKAQFKPCKSEFKIEFTYDIFSKTRKDLDVGQYHKNVLIQFSDTEFILESVFLGKHSPPTFTGIVDKIHTKGFSEKVEHYYQLVIPLEKELEFHYTIEETKFTTDLGYHSICSTTATIKEDSIQACCIHNDKKEYFLVIDSQIKQTFDAFAEKANAVKIGIGYLSGYYAGNQGYYFAYTSKKKKNPKHFRCVQLRGSMKSKYHPVYSNSYRYLHRNKLAEKYYPLLRPVSTKEFSLLCEKIHASIDFSSMLMLVLESSVASLLFKPGGYAIALETLSDLVIGKNKLKLAPIKDKTVSKKIRAEFLEVLSKHSSSILPDDLETLQNRVNQLNQTTNKSRLKAPFDILEIKLLEEDLKILDTRNDFLHGRVPDLTNAGKNRSTERINKDLYYASVRFYTLLNMIILKWVGYDNRVVNYPKIQESFTQIKIEEEPFRKV